MGQAGGSDCSMDSRACDRMNRVYRIRSSVVLTTEGRMDTDARPTFYQKNAMAQRFLRTASNHHFLVFSDLGVNFAFQNFLYFGCAAQRVVWRGHAIMAIAGCSLT